MTHRLTTTNCAKNYCNRTLIVKVIVENVVTFFERTKQSVSTVYARPSGLYFWYNCKKFNGTGTLTAMIE